MTDHYTDYSSGRKDPLRRDLRVSSSKAQTSEGPEFDVSGIDFVEDADSADDNMHEFERRAHDMNIGRNCFEHELIEEGSTAHA